MTYPDLLFDQSVSELGPVSTVQPRPDKSSENLVDSWEEVFEDCVETLSDLDEEDFFEVVNISGKGDDPCFEVIQSFNKSGEESSGDESCDTLKFESFDSLKFESFDVDVVKESEANVVIKNPFQVPARKSPDKIRVGRMLSDVAKVLKKNTDFLDQIPSMDITWDHNYVPNNSVSDDFDLDTSFAGNGHHIDEEEEDKPVQLFDVVGFEKCPLPYRISLDKLQFNQKKSKKLPIWAAVGHGRPVKPFFYVNEPPLSEKIPFYEYKGDMMPQSS
jgi:hypothetical protein